MSVSDNCLVCGLGEEIGTSYVSVPGGHVHANPCKGIYDRQREREQEERAKELIRNADKKNDNHDITLLFGILVIIILSLIAAAAGYSISKETMIRYEAKTITSDCPVVGFAYDAKKSKTIKRNIYKCDDQLIIW